MGAVDERTGGETRDRWVTDLYPPRYHGLRGDEPGRALDGERWHRLDRGEPLTEAETDALLLDVSFTLEQTARRVFADRQFKGVMRGEGTLVWDSRSAARIGRALRRRPPSPAVREHLDRALAWWQAALDAGLEIYEWDRPGYDRITGAFAGLASFAKERPTIDPEAHGVEVVRVAPPARVRTRPPRVGVPLRTAWGATKIQFVGTVLVTVVALLVVAVKRCGRTPARPRSCAEIEASVRSLAARVEEGRPSRAPLLAEVRAQVDAGEAYAAFQRWDAASTAERGARPLAGAGAAAVGEPPEVDLHDAHEVLLGAELMLLSQCQPRPRR
ncbi:MAG: hypothetical protein KC486_06875 [Myxococcales bacterium]|nr:hypothetical protein [Myxococcales bacterium]